MRSLPDVASRTEYYHIIWLKFEDLWRLDICFWQKFTHRKKEIILQCCLFKRLFQAAELGKSQQNLSNEPNRLLLLRLGATNDKLQLSHLWPRMQHNWSEELFSEVACICNYKWVIMQGDSAYMVHSSNQCSEMISNTSFNQNILEWSSLQLCPEDSSLPIYHILDFKKKTIFLLILLNFWEAACEASDSISFSVANAQLRRNPIKSYKNVVGTNFPMNKV